MTEYRKAEIAKILGESSRKIQYLVDEGLVIPDISPPSGKGKAMIFSEKNLIEFEMIRLLQKKCKLKLREIRSILDSLRRKKYAPDFYTNLNWGQNWEIIYCKAEAIQKENLIFYRIFKDDDGFFKISADPNTKFNSRLEKLVDEYLHFETVMVGKIKIMAMKNLGLLK